MTEDYWASSQLSVARYYGRVKIDGHEYIIVNKEGKDIFQCSVEAKKAGREKAIEPGEPADLVRKDFVPHYRKLGRDKFLEVLKFYGSHNDDKHLKEYMKKAVEDMKPKTTAKMNDLFENNM
jgi:hypothetical protein